MRRWAIIVLAGWIGVIAAHVHASSGVPAPPPAMTGMDCCPTLKPDCPDNGKQDKGCVGDTACMARCTFVQSAMAGPALSYHATIVTLDAGIARSTLVLRSRAYPPERPPKRIFQT
jgi:hypothetical protein